MKHYQQFLTIVNALKKGTKFAITQDWLLTNGIQASAGDAKSLGYKFATDYIHYSCVKLSKGSDNHILYEKQ